MRAIAAIILLSRALLPAAQAGVDGQWEAVIPGSPSGVLLELKSEGDRLTGWLSQPNGKMEITNGSIKGTTISFEMAINRQGQAFTLVYSGQLDGDELHLTLRPRGIPGEERVTMKRVDPHAAPLDRFRENPAPDDVAAWVKANAIRLSSVQADAGFADMAPLEARLRDARIVAMGEATHGTREFQQLKVRMFRFLVEKLGFSVFGIEANRPESLEVNEYVLGGNVDSTRGLGLWSQTEDMAALLRWMRQYNQDPAHTRKLKFYGFDMQMPGLAESNVLNYLRRVDPEVVDTATGIFDLLGPWGVNEDYEAATAEVKRRTADSLATLLRRFDERKQEYVGRSSLHDWSMARQNMVIVQQAEVKLGSQDQRGRAFRDRAMAENVRWILDQEPPGTKMMLWAHNGHVAASEPLDAPDYLPMGGHLHKLFGDRLVSCGFIFQQGSFRAVNMADANRVRAFTVGPPPRGSLDATLAGLGIPLFAIDLRHLPEGTVANWFAEPHFSRQIGGGYSELTPGVWMHRVRAARAFDLLIFIDKTTPSR